ncbi:MAG TPA: AmmeMemoRadiSam system radical SAM enzyme [Firmicutes bacterium]|nr:AmmeMemoRadiSam system radical SAM enzyme [Bacillota bacterium]
MEKARFYTRVDDKIRCLLCPRHCLLKEGQEGVCGVRQVSGGELYTTNYGLCAAVNWDPIEKKPLYHFYPGSKILSLGTYGCNLECSFCQNWSLARGRPEHGGTTSFSPHQVLEMIQARGVSFEKAPGVSFTYNEPTVWYEFVYDTAKLLHRHGYVNVLVTNGYISLEALDEILPYIDAFNLDLKGFTGSFYREYCRGQRDPVLTVLERAANRCHVEVTCLLIPSVNDAPEDLEQMVSWLAGLNPDLPLHISRYFPSHQLNIPPTPLETLYMAREIALKKLNYVYIGNVPVSEAANTYCPQCSRLVIERSGYRTRVPGLHGQNCRYCGQHIPLIL